MESSSRDNDPWVRRGKRLSPGSETPIWLPGDFSRGGEWEGEAHGELAGHGL